VRWSFENWSYVANSFKWVYLSIPKSCLPLIFLLLLFSIPTSADVFTGNITLEVTERNVSSTFNFTSQLSGDNSGHVKIYNTTYDEWISTVGNVSIMNLGIFTDDYTGDVFSNDFVQVPNSSFSDFHGIIRDYEGEMRRLGGNVQNRSYEIRLGSAFAFRIFNSSVNGSPFYGVMFARERDAGINVTFVYKFNNQSGNSTFGLLSGCSAHQNFSDCLGDTDLDCDWSSAGICTTFDGYHEVPPAFCDMLPRTACDWVNNDTCNWDTSLGRGGLCAEVSGASFNVETGFNCTQIINDTLCDNQPFTELTGLCSWDESNTICLVNSSKNFLDIPSPPVFSCEAPGYVNNQTACEILSNDFFLPCGWNSTTNKCSTSFFDFGKFNDFEDIGSENTCGLMGGTWKVETTFDPVSNSVTEESWCEVTSSPIIFSSIGGGGNDFQGDFTQLGSCASDCFACEFNSTGNRWPNASEAQLECEASAVGCVFENDTNAFNGFGWCDPILGGGGLSCDISCGDCNLLPNAQNACLNSTSACRWDNVTSLCIGSGAKSCLQDCFQCGSENSCNSSGANGGCSWDSSSYFCTPKSGKFEICFDGIDNDGNGDTDCQDFKCGSDSFCAGGITDTNNCFQYDDFKFGLNAQGNCTDSPGCVWITDEFSHSYCAPLSEQCWRNNSFFDDQTGCEDFGGGGVCIYETGGSCHENSTLFNVCGSISIENTCNNEVGCKWSSEHSFCDVETIVVCEDNATLQIDQNACTTAGCVWQGGLFSSGFEGGHVENCVSPCINLSITTKEQCGNATTDNTPFYNQTCVFFGGHCEPADFIGGCFQNDGDINACRANANCNWISDGYGPIRDLNRSTSFNDFLFPGGSWLTVGLQRPLIKDLGKNISNYTIYHLNPNISMQLVMTGPVKPNQQSRGENLSQIYCNGTIMFQHNNSATGSCLQGTCNAYNLTTCSGVNVHYFLNSSRGELEVLWEQPLSVLVFDVAESNGNVTTIINMSTVLIDGNLSEHLIENATSGDGTNSTRILSAPGFCFDGFSDHFFKGMDFNAPLQVAFDASGDHTPTGHDYLDFTGIGVKKTPEAYAYGMPTVGMTGSAVCNGIPISGTSPGTGKNTSRYYLYLDTDGQTTGSCAPPNNSSLSGFEYRFKYVAEFSSDTGRVSETTISQQCSGGIWVASNVPFKGDRKKGCDFVQGPILAIDRDTFAGKSDVNTSKGWRAYATSASAQGNASNISDSVGPGKADFKGIDASLVDCSSTEHNGNDECSTFRQFGFFPGEFGPACGDGIDNDGDSLIDCSDFDCIYDPFFCSGSFGAVEGDDSAPAFVWTKVNKKFPTALTFIFDTNEPANGTVRFYNNDTRCGTLNSTFRDKALDDGDIFTNYRPHHVVDATDLTANKTYFYKLVACDPSDNCAISACSNATTALKHTNITFKLDIPIGWTVDIPSINLSNYSANYALKASTAFLNNINLTLNASNTTESIKFVGISIFERQTLNLSIFTTGSSLLGMDSNLFQSFLQRTGVEEVIITIPTTSQGDTLQHCDDAGTSCQNVTGVADCTFSSTTTVCTLPVAVGFGFSTYKSTTAAVDDAAGDTGGGGGGGGGGGSGSSGGGGVTSTFVNQWNNLGPGPAEFTISNIRIPISHFSFVLLRHLSKPQITISSLDEKPVSSLPPTSHSSIFRYISIEKNRIGDADIANVRATFTVPRSWLNSNRVSENDIVLLRWNSGAWHRLSTRIEGATSHVVTYSSAIPGFSYFAIAGKSEITASEPTIVQVDESEKVEIVVKEHTNSDFVINSKSFSRELAMWVILGVIAAAIVIYIVHLEITRSRHRRRR
jgi:PGF-pre-PGF domain-containing protein